MGLGAVEAAERAATAEHDECWIDEVYASRKFRLTTSEVTFGKAS